MKVWECDVLRDTEGAIRKISRFSATSPYRKRSHEKGKKMCTLRDRANPSGKIGDYAVRYSSDQRPCVSEAVVS